MQVTFTFFDLVLAGALGQLLAIGIYCVAKAVVWVWTIMQEFRRYKLELQWHKKG